ncbi:MAG: MerR family transcriptional regulator [Thermoleophilia bacterium]|nr:MerR family transcriptional regulator [Thermoleophilia bacterium]
MAEEIEKESGEITIEDLARLTGMTVRNIRAHQSRGLLPPPRVIGRTGYYDEEHISRIALIRELQEEGMNLEAIRRILESTGNSSRDLLSFTRSFREPYEDEQPEILEISEIAQPWGETALDKDGMRRLEELGLMRRLGDGRIEVLSPKLLAAGVELAELGVPAADALSALESLRDRSGAVAEVFIQVFNELFWEPFDRAGRPPDEWPRVQDALQRMRPLAADALLASFQLAMDEATEGAIGEMIRRDLETDRSGPPGAA